jgi:hypothetical protein
MELRIILKQKEGISNDQGCLGYSISSESREGRLDPSRR